MEVIFSFVALSVITTILALYLKDTGLPAAAMVTALCGGILLLLKVLPYAADLFRSVKEISDASGLQTDYLALVLKVVCIAYIGEFASQICRDAGEGGLARKLDLGVKVVIMVMAMPLLQTILTTVLDVFR